MSCTSHLVYAGTTPQSVCCVAITTQQTDCGIVGLYTYYKNREFARYV